MKQGYVYIANNIFHTLLALSEKEQEVGLMNIDPPVPNMTFVYAHSKINKFWMKSTRAPLDIIFSYKGEVSQICKGEPYSTSIIGDNKYSDLIVEMPYGTVFLSGIKLGHKMGLIEPNEMELKKIISSNLTKL